MTRLVQHSNLDLFIAGAKSHLGYRTRPGGQSDFSAQIGYTSHDTPWAGAFIDIVARDAGLKIPSCVYTPTGLAEFSQQGRLKFRPRPGDIVFFGFATDKDFGTPHCGIVVDTTGVRMTDRFMTVEGNVNSGLPKGSQDRDGVHLRERWIYDAIGFGRPDFKARPSSKAISKTVAIELKFSNVRPGRKGRDIATVQLALEQFTDLRGFTAGVFDSSTKDAYARWQRMSGYVATNATGIPDLHSLEKLGRDSGLFTIIVS